MPIKQVNFLAKTLRDVQSWFLEIYNHLNATNYNHGDWVPEITGITDGATWWPDSVNVDAGSIAAGAVSSVVENDNVFLVVSELSGTPALEFDFTFSGVFASVSGENVITLIGYYEGNAAHNVVLNIYNYNTASWDAVTGAASDFPSRSTKTTYTFNIPDKVNHISIDGQVKLEIKHTSSGAAGHHFHIDELKIYNGDPASYSISGWFYRFGPFLFVNAEIAGTYTAEGAHITNLPFKALFNGSSLVSNITDNLSIGNSYIETGTTKMHLPDHSIINKTVVITGFCKINGV